MSSRFIDRLIDFVQAEFGISNAEIGVALHHDDCATQFPMILWQYGFITVEQLDTLFDWLEHATGRFVDG